MIDLKKSEFMIVSVLIGSSTVSMNNKSYHRLHKWNTYIPLIVHYINLLVQTLELHFYLATNGVPSDAIVFFLTFFFSLH